MNEYRVFISHGEVQGVGYRQFVWKTATQLGLTGQVRNLKDGTVQTLAQGSRKQLEKCHMALREGPVYAQVSHVSEKVLAHKADHPPKYAPHGEIAEVDWTSFKIIYK